MKLTEVLESNVIDFNKKRQERGLDNPLGSIAHRDALYKKIEQSTFASKRERPKSPLKHGEYRIFTFRTKELEDKYSIEFFDENPDDELWDKIDIPGALKLIGGVRDKSGYRSGGVNAHLYADKQGNLYFKDVLHGDEYGIQPINYTVDQLPMFFDWEWVNHMDWA